LAQHHLHADASAAGEPQANRGARQMCRASLFFLLAIYDLILKNIVDENETTATEFEI
jgi:hypothetical protein